MAYRKKIESWLEKDCSRWPDATLKLLESNISSYTWKVEIDQTHYEINYSDSGYIVLSSLPAKSYITSEVREIYQGDNSEQSYKLMINLLSDNLTEII
jgi:hypothetical protein